MVGIELRQKVGPYLDRLMREQGVVGAPGRADGDAPAAGAGDRARADRSRRHRHRRGARGVTAHRAPPRSRRATPTDEALMDRERAIALLTGLVRIRSLSGEEKEASTWLAEQARPPGTTAPSSTTPATRWQSSATSARRASSCCSDTSTPCRARCPCASRRATARASSTGAARSTPRVRSRRSSPLERGSAAPGRARPTCVSSSPARSRRRQPRARARASSRHASTARASRCPRPASSASPAVGIA